MPPGLTTRQSSSQSFGGEALPVFCVFQDCDWLRFDVDAREPRSNVVVSAIVHGVQEWWRGDDQIDRMLFGYPGVFLESPQSQVKLGCSSIPHAVAEIGSSAI